MQSFLTSPVQEALPHALPFRILLEEHRLRDEERLERAAADVFRQIEIKKRPPEATTELQLAGELARQEAAYAELKKISEALLTTDRDLRLDGCLKRCATTDASLKMVLHAMESSALCLSGGGIRSASFGLGVLEGLARFSRRGHPRHRKNGLMRRLDYLSTVSGGGYIGSWLSAWIYRRKMTADKLTDPPAGDDAATTAGKPLSEKPWSQAYGEVLAALAGTSNVTGGDPEPMPSRHLRSYTSYLAPALGMTLDTFTLVAIILRNWMVNWTMIVPVLVAAIAAAESSAYLFQWATGDPRAWFVQPVWASLRWFTWGGLLISVCVVLMAFAAIHVQPSQRKENANGVLWVRLFLAGVLAGCWLLAASATEQRGSGLFWSKFLIAALGYGILGLSIVRSHAARRRAIKREPEPTLKSARAAVKAHAPQPEPVPWLKTKYALAVVAALSMAAATSGLLYWAQGDSVFGVLRHPPVDVRATPPVSAPSPANVAVTVNVLPSACSSTGAVPSGCGSCCSATAKLTPDATVAEPSQSFLSKHGSEGRLFTVFAPPIVLLILTLTATIFTALLGRLQTEDDREWWVRAGGAMLAAGLGWMAVHGAALYGRGGWLYIKSGIAGLVLGLAGSALGFSPATAATARVSSGDAGKLASFLSRHKLILPAIGGASLLLIGLGMVTLEEDLRRVVAQHILQQDGTLYLSQGLRSAFLLLVLSVVAAVLINWAMSVNLFSLSGMYRMRLMRAFLGASNVYRHPDPFTQFDWRDTPYMVDLPCGPGAPLHVVNATLNLSGTKNAAWRQRKGEGFSFSALAAGGWRVGFVSAELYGGSHGTTLATAMAISGAAANPNMGYQTSPLLSLLMTFFNLRLGYWLPNPAQAMAKKTDEQRKDYLQSSAPALALQPLLADALGLTDDTSDWVELTDGGHFENLGLYEMVLRRCRHIVVVDAGADKNFEYEDLGNAIRKIKIDLGVEITFETPLRRGKDDADGIDCAVAQIRYCCVDGDDAPDGRLVYLKPCVSVAGLPGDVFQYAKTHASFPHESTGNQFFTESQFESYRRLGSWLVEQIGGPGSTHAVPADGYGMEGFYCAAQRYAQAAVK